MIAAHNAMIIISRDDLIFTNKGKNDKGHVLIDAFFKPGVLEKLRCPHCGSTVIVYKDRYHRGFHDLKADRIIDYILPIVQCTNTDCPHHLSDSDEQPGYQDGATHVILPSFMAPYLRIDVNIMNDLALAQEELNKLGFKGRCMGDKFKEATRHSALFKRLKKRYKELWSYLLDLLNTKQSKSYLAYLIRFRTQLQAFYTQTCLNHFYQNGKRAVNGWLKHGDYYCKEVTHRLTWMLRMVLSEFCPRNREYLIYPPWDFWKKVQPYRDI